MNKKLTFVSGNHEKYVEVKTFLTLFSPSLEIEHQKLDLEEIQSLDLKKVAIMKAQDAWKVLKRPLIIDDGGCYLNAYHNFPGALSKFVFEGIGMDGIFKLLEGTDRSATFRTFIVFIDGPHSYELFEGTCTGTLQLPRATTKLNPSLPWRAYFKPNVSDTTYDEFLKTKESLHHHHRAQALKKFADWYTAKKQRERRVYSSLS